MKPLYRSILLTLRAGDITHVDGVATFEGFATAARALSKAGLVEHFAADGVASWRATAEGRARRMRRSSGLARQRRGQGSITITENGAFRVRGPDSRRTNIGQFATAEEAAEVLEAARRQMAEAGPPRGEITLSEYGQKVLDDRELAGYRGVATERRCFSKHVLRSSLGALALSVITSADVRQFVKAVGRQPADDKRGARTLSHHTVKRALSIVSSICAAGVEAGIIESNPAASVKVKARADTSATKDKWAYLTADEQRSLETCTTIPEAEKLIVLFAIGTGLRQGEQWNLELRDLHVDDDVQGGPHLIVRYGSKGKPPKNGKTRRVPLFGVGLYAAKRWLELLPAYVTGQHAVTRNEAGLAFPGTRGSRRQCGKFGRHGDLDALLQEAGITKHLRWHDLRHTCASSLVSGIWGRTWTLHETCEMLGHSSVQVTERYAHVGHDFLTRAAMETGRLAAPVRAAPVAMSIDQMRKIVAEADRAAVATGASIS